MTRLIPTAAVAALTVLTASCAPVDDMSGSSGSASARPERQCFSAEQVRNFRSANSGRLYIRAMRDVYELNSSGGCTDLDFAQRLAITPDVGGLAGGRICTGNWARITIPGSASPITSCRARVDRVLTQAEVEALPRGQRP
ncbi:hypothetical protein GGQ87_000592 [Brevundimonas alba]|uniref:Lipoprotein n=1 Tax=Brevundimonas alba TaxID=74314 RepID=A0A7X5YIL3_9CAUL|nr:DUF6491 family protein [Brevundimonas alba]NJC40334.1 hypothetical protein [Brevundimonas alba]